MRSPTEWKMPTQPLQLDYILSLWAQWEKPHSALCWSFSGWSPVLYTNSGLFHFIFLQFLCVLHYFDFKRNACFKCFLIRTLMLGSADWFTQDDPGCNNGQLYKHATNIKCAFLSTLVERSTDKGEMWDNGWNSSSIFTRTLHFSKNMFYTSQKSCYIFYYHILGKVWIKKRFKEIEQGTNGLRTTCNKYCSPCLSRLSFRIFFSEYNIMMYNFTHLLWQCLL